MTQTETQLSIKRWERTNDKFAVLQVFFLFSSTKIGHDRPSVKDRYAISDKNILRSCVVRYFYLKFLACRSPMPWEMYKKKGKKCIGCPYAKQCSSHKCNVNSSVKRLKK